MSLETPPPLARPAAFLLLLALAPTPRAGGGDDIPTFERIQADTAFRAEGGTAFDVDGDGHSDLVVGPYWYAGPDFGERFALYAPQEFDPAGYSDAFFAWPFDGDGDEHTDVFMVGFPGQAAAWFENPGGRPATEAGGLWPMHPVLESVDNESPHFVDLVGDADRELVCQTGGRFGYATPDPDDPRAPWVFHPLSPDLGLGRFTHGLGVGDVDGDGRADVLWRDGWWEQPADLAGDPAWAHHDVAFSKRGGGAQMLVLDADGDGDHDVVSSLAAHGFGLSWFEQEDGSDGLRWTEHPITDDQPEDNPYGVRLGEIHALDLADMDGDGLQDVVCGKRWWSHGASGDPEPGAPAVVYAFLLRRTEDGVDWLPCLVDDDSGVGVQVSAIDVDGDERMDVVVGNKKGAFVLRQAARRAPAPAVVFADRADADVGAGGLAEDQAIEPRAADGSSVNLDLESGDLAGWTAAGEAFAGQPVTGDTVQPRRGDASGHQGRHWIGGYELHGDEPTGTLTSSPFRVTRPWASLLVGGGNLDGTRVELVRADDGTVVFRISGGNHETMQRVAVDLRELVGTDLRVRLVDEETGGWGHVNYDDLRLHAERPSFSPPPGVPRVLPEDEVLHAGLAPADAADAMTLPAGFQLDLIAAEPDLHQPVAFTLDGRGRIWVAEAHSYPAKRTEGEGLDRIVVFEDRDLDGSFEARTVFLEGLNLVSGLEVGHGGVWIGQAPELLFVPDADDDLVPDGPPEVLLDGWGYQDTHETLNAFNWGPDGWLYGCHGVFTHSRVGKPGSPDDERVPLNAAVWRYHPTRHEFEVFAWGSSNPWGIDWNDEGQAFITACVIPHLYHVVQGGRYQRQAGDHFRPWVYEDIQTIADHRHYLGDTPHSGNLRSNAVGGGHAHCGALVYLGDQFPAEYRGAVFMNNIHGNRVNVDLPAREGSGYVGRHGDDLLLSNDKWFRGIAFRTGADGSVYLIDWYDEQACHVNDAARWDRSNGRLYRLSYGEPTARALDLPALSSEELVELQLADNDYLVRRARLELQRRGPDADVAARLADLVRGAGATPKRLRALWALHSVRGLDGELGRELLGDADEYVTAWAVQLLCERGTPAPGIVERFVDLARETSSPVVRLYLASALQRLDPGARWDLVAALAARAEDADDRNLPLLVWYGLAPLVEEAPERALAIARASEFLAVRRGAVRFAASRRDCLPALISAVRAEADPERQAWMLGLIEEALEGERGLTPPAGWSELAAELEASGDDALGEHAMRLSVAFGDARAFPRLRAIASEAGAPTEQRIEAVDALVRGKDPEVVPLLLDLLDDEALQGLAVRALASFQDPRIGKALVQTYGGADLALRRDVLNTLGARAGTAATLLDAVERGAIPRGDVGAFVRRKLDSLRDEALIARADEVLGRYRPSSEDTVARIAAWKEQLTPERLGAGDRAMGRAVFERTCQQCHVLFGEGGTLGPDLTGSNRRDLDYLLTNVVDPNEVIGRDYQTTNAWLLDGSVVSGIERGRTDTAVTLQTENDTVVVAFSEADEIALSPLSTMPEGLLDPLRQEEVVDLVAYLQGDEQAPPVLSAGDEVVLFDGKSLAGWSGDEALWSVEDGALVGRTAEGIEHNAFLVSDLVAGDFRLELEVQLVDGVGNSGVQFRSRPLPGGEVAGYQADIGAGWWGKLYEELGRAVLSDTGAASAVRPDGWNTYVIEARGARVRTWLNGVLSVDLEDPDGARTGHFALQLHSGGPTEVRFRGLELTPLE